MYRLAFFLLVFTFISCEETSTGESDSGTPGDFDVIADSSYYELSVVHNSHMPEEIKSYDDTPGIVLDLRFTLSDTSKREEIEKVIIFDNDGLGWDFSREELNDFYSDDLGGYTFENLLIKHGVYEADKLFFIRLINDENQKSRDYQFILKGELPYSVTDRSYWFRDNELKFEYTVQPYYYNNVYGYYYQGRGYNPVLASNSAKLNWLDENQNLIESTGNVINSFSETEYELVYENTFSNISESAEYSYHSFSLQKANSEYHLLTQISPVADKIPGNTEFYTLTDYRLKLLYLNENRSVFLEPNPDNQEFSFLTIYNRQTQEQTDKIELYYDIYNDYQPVFVNEDTEMIYYISDLKALSSYNLSTGETQELLSDFDDINTIYLFPFGDNIVVYGDHTLYLYDLDENQVRSVRSSTNLDDVNSYYYLENLDELFLGEEEERFYKITYNYTTDSFKGTETLYTNSRVSSYSQNHQNIHFSSPDSVLIHTSGAVIDVSSGTEFNADSALIVRPFLSSPISAWLEQEQVLVIREDNNYQHLSAYKYTGTGFSKIGELTIAGEIIDLLSYEGKVMVTSLYPDYNFSKQYIAVSGYTLDDFSPPMEKRAFKNKYHIMQRVQS